MQTRKLVWVFFLLIFSSFNFGHAAFPVQKANEMDLISQSQKAKNTTDITLKKKQMVSQESQVLVSPAAGGEKSQLVALLLVIFVGGIGIHRFYLGYIGIGIIQLLTLGGCGIWSLIDLIRIIIGDLKPKDGSYSEKGRL